MSRPELVSIYTQETKVKQYIVIKHLHSEKSEFPESSYISTFLSLQQKKFLFGRTRINSIPGKLFLNNFMPAARTWGFSRTITEAIQSNKEAK